VIALALRAFARTWPALLAWFLAGWTVRLLLLRLAGWAAENIDPLVGQLILPLAVLARLASYIGMFLVLRPVLAHFERLEQFADRTVPGAPRGFFATWAATLNTSILPFFLIYAAWGLIADDAYAYSAASLDQMVLDFDAPVGPVETPLDTPLSFATVAIVVVAFTLRRLIARFATKLPAWIGAITVYLEAVWIITALSFIGQLLAGVPDWLASRRMFAWAVNGWEQWRESLDWVRAIGDGIAWIAQQLGDVVAQPLAWLTLAAIVLAGALPLARRTRSRRRTRLDAARVSATRRWRRIGPRTRRILMLPLNGIVERWQPIGTALRLIWRAGPLAMGFYVLAFGVLTVASAWLGWAAYHAVGPHELSWFAALDQPISLVIDTIVFPLQLCLVAAAFDRCLRALDETVTTPAAELAEIHPTP